MKKRYTAALIFIFFLTLGNLGWHIFSGAGTALPAWQGQNRQVRTQTGALREVASISLGKVEVYNYQRMGFTRGFLQFSPDGQYLAVGTENGEVLMLGINGQVLWQKQLGLGKLTALQFTADSQAVLIGESSPDGLLVCLDRSDGRELWRYSSAGELGVDIKNKTFPGIVAIRTDDAGRIYAVGQRYIRYPDGRYDYRGRLYKFDPSGERLGLFPDDHNLDAWVSWLSVDAKGEKLVFGTANWDMGGVSRYADSLYCVDGQLRGILWSKLLPPAPPFQNTTLRSGPEFSPDGQVVTGIFSDGRCFLYDGQGRELWLRTLSSPQKIANVELNAVGTYGQMAGEYAVFSVSNTYNRANWQLPTPVEHPSSNSVFVFDRQGQLASRYKLGGMIEEMAVQEQTLVLAVGRNVRTKNPAVHGLYVLSLPDAKLLDYAATSGPTVGAAVSADGVYAAGVEAPIQLDSGEVIGEYKLRLYRIVRP